MHKSWLLITITCLLLAACGVSTDVEEGIIYRRQDSPSTGPPPSITPTPANTGAGSSASSSNGPSSPSPSSASATAGHSGKSDDGAQTSAGGGSSGTSVMASSTMAMQSTLSGIVIGASATPIPSSTYNGTITPEVQIDGLPIQPSITPAMAVAGAIMMVTGAFYTLIGIKTQRVHIFFSTAYLFSLAVTVLIEYVMHPPISNGIQAAYFVAACVTGAVFGAVAMIFSDVTEGLGCFLGGFCLSMWFLVLKAGGLIESTAGKAIFIACFTVGTFALYLSHYTRPYGIIGSTSFAGATVVILGIDCFSRAGLKEFWLYIWNLNNGLFPLNYAGPYPITRGIRVEIAGIVFIFILGVMSQMKVWKIVKERKEARAAEQRRKDEERDKAEEALGRQLEADNQQERAMWDAVYGDKHQTKVSQLDSGIGTDAPSSTRKSSMSVADAQGMEMQDLSGSRSVGPDGGKIMIRVAEDEALETSSSVGAPSARSVDGVSREPSVVGSVKEDARSVVSHKRSVKATSGEVEPQAAQRTRKEPKMKNKTTSKLKVVPLPFKVPDEVPNKEDDASSVATFAASDYPPDRTSKRLSGSSLMRKMSGRSQRRQSNLAKGISEEALIVSHVDDDQASSIAATLDGVSDKADSDNESISSKDNIPVPVKSDHALVTASPATAPAVETQHKASHEDQAQTNGPQPALVEAQSVKPEDKAVIPGETPKSELDASTLKVSEKADQSHVARKASSSGSIKTTETSEALSVRKSLARNLPKGASRVEMAYRTNEWAKHLDRADAPAAEDINVDTSQAILTKDHVAPVNVQALQQTALSAEPMPEVSQTVQPAAGSKVSTRSAESPANVENNPSNIQHNSPSPRPIPSNAGQVQPVTSLERQPSQISLTSSNGSQEESPRPSLTKLRGNSSTLSVSRGLRSSSSPLTTSPLASSPIQEDVEATFPPKFTPSSSHLMSQRDSLLRNKPSSTSLLRTTSAGSMNRLSNFNTPNASSALLHGVVEDEGDEGDTITLAQRKSMLQRNSSRSSLIHRTLSSGAITPAANGSRLSLAPQTTATFVDNNPYHQLQSQPSITNLNPPHAARPHQSADPAAVSSWRASLAQMPHTAESQQAIEIERRRSQLLAEKQAQKRSQAVASGQKEQRESVLGREMRRGSMLDAHREAMRRMQGQVNEKMKQ